jgi:hypothetical protein
MMPLFTRVSLLAAIFYLLTITPGRTAPDHAKVAFEGEPDPFGEPFAGGLVPYTLSNTGEVFFYRTGLFGATRIYRGTAAGTKRGIKSGTAAPNGGTFIWFDTLDVNAAAQYTFKCSTSNSGSNIYAVLSDKIVIVALRGDPAPGDGLFINGNYGDPFEVPAINDAGQVAFKAMTSVSGGGVFLASPNGAKMTVARVAIIGQDSKDGGTFSAFGRDVAVNKPAAGLPQVAFTATTTGAPGSGLYLGTTAAVHRVAAGSHTEFAMNNAGQVVFEDNGIWIGTTAGATKVMANGNAAPGGRTFSYFQAPVINDAGQLAFRAATTDGKFGIFRWTPPAGMNPAVIEQVALQDDAAPGGGTYNSVQPPQMNNAGLVLFLAAVNKSVNVLEAIMLGDGTDTVKMIGEGDALNASVVQDLQLGEIGRLPGHGSLNEKGQACYSADLATQKRGIFIATPSLRWRDNGDGLWNDASRWSFGIAPSAAHGVSIDPATNAVVTGPSAAAEVRSLRIGGGAGLAELVLQRGVTLTTEGATVLTNGTLSGSGTIAGSLTLQTGARVALRIGGKARGANPAQGGYDFVRTTKAIALAGALEVTFAPGFTPAHGASFDLLDFAGRTGQFDTVNLPALPAGAQWNTTKLGTTGAITISAPTFFQAHAGVFTGVIAAAPLAHETTGAIVLTVSADGSVKAKGTLAGKAFSANGVLDFNGRATLSFGKPEAELKLQLDLGNPGNLTGSLKAGTGALAQLTAERTALAFDPASPLVGSYTIALPADPTQDPATFPQGTGYALLSVSKKGLAKLTGALGDGTAISFGGPVTASGKLPIYLSRYGNKGSLSGVLTLHGATPNDAVDGTLHWAKPATATPKWYPAAFAGEIVVDGSGFQPPPGRPQILNLANATFRVSAGGIGAVPPKAVTIDAQNKVTAPGDAKLKVTLAKSGLFSGTFLDGDGKSRAFKGVVIQRTNEAAAFFKGNERTGAVKLE